MANLFSTGLRIDPNIMSTLQNDYWEEFDRVNDVFVHEPDITIRQVRNVPITQNGKQYLPKSKSHANSTPKSSRIYPAVPGTENLNTTNSSNAVALKGDESRDQEYVELKSVGVQTDDNYDEELELPYRCCCCFRSSTPGVVWFFVGISLVFFKMGAIVTGRWIYLTSSSFDEVVFYIAFTVCLGFGTIYFRRSTKYHNPFDLLFLLLTIPIMWALLTFTTTFLKKDIFFYVGSIIFSVFIVPYTLVGSYIAYRFWKTGKIFIRRVEGNKELEPLCRRLFFTQSLITFDVQLTVCASIISMAPSINNESTVLWVASLVIGPICIVISLISWIVGYFGIRRENMKLTILFTGLGVNQVFLVLSMLAKRPAKTGPYNVFINASMIAWTSVLLAIHFCVLFMVWKWIVPYYGKGLRGPLNRTSRNNVIQCAKLTICR